MYWPHLSTRAQSDGGALIPDTFRPTALPMPAVPRDKIRMSLKCLTTEELVEMLLVEVCIDFI